MPQRYGAALIAGMIVVSECKSAWAKDEFL